MQSEPSTKNRSPSYPPLSFLSRKKIVIVCIILTILGLIGLILFISGKSNPQFISSVPIVGNLFLKPPISNNNQNISIAPALSLSPTPITTSIKWIPTIPQNLNLDVTADKIVKWLNAQKNEQGLYDKGYYCTEKGVCEAPKKDFKIGLAAVWGKYRYFLYKKNAVDKNSAIEELKNILKPESDLLLQMSTWNCKLMYDLWKDNIFNTDEKDVILKICKKEQFFPVDDDQLTNFIKNNPSYDVEVKSLSYNPELPIGLTNDDNWIDVYPIYSSDYAYKYLFTKDEQFLKKAKLYLLKAMYVYKTNKEKAQYTDSLTGLAAYDLFQISNNKDYLDLAVNILNNRTTGVCQTLSDCIATIMLAKQIGETDNNSKYLDIANRSFEYMITRGLDDSNFPRAVTNTGVLHSMDTVKVFFPVYENGLFLGMISDMLIK